jgi:hypothetical protein
MKFYSVHIKKKDTPWNCIIAAQHGVSFWFKYLDNKSLGVWKAKRTGAFCVKLSLKLNT